MIDQDSYIVCAGRQARRKEGMPPGMSGSLNNRFFVPEYSKAVTQLKTEDKIKKLICDAEKDGSVFKALSDHDLDNVLKHLSSTIKEKERMAAIALIIVYIVQ